MAATMVDVGGYKLAAEISGEGSPTVVFISGTGDAGEPWDAAIAALQSSTTLVTYARSGIGDSVMPADSRPRSIGAAAEELRGLLASAGVGRPAVLVGYSFGPLIDLYFAATWPQDVAGLVMVDSTDIHLNLDIEKPQTVIPDRDEDEGMSFDVLASVEEVERSTRPLDVPSVVISSRAGRWMEIESIEHWLPFTREALEVRWQRNHAALAAELGAVHKIARFGDHYVQIDDPTIVAEAIDDLIVAAR
jgi:pimeloyl-ACP methyl ester carboxylesterase